MIFKYWCCYKLKHEAKKCPGGRAACGFKFPKKNSHAIIANSIVLFFLKLSTLYNASNLRPISCSLIHSTGALSRSANKRTYSVDEYGDSEAIPYINDYSFLCGVFSEHAVNDPLQRGHNVTQRLVGVYEFSNAYHGILILSALQTKE